MLALFMLAALTNSEEVLQRVRQQVLEDLAQVPNYTCTETITRSTRAKDSKKFKQLDSIHLEVALVNGGELFAWPGGKFQQLALSKMLGDRGLSANGDFAQHLKGVFDTDHAIFSAGEEIVEKGKKKVRFQYRVPVTRSNYILSSGPPPMFRVAYHGAITADAETYSMLRLEVITAPDLPQKLDIREAAHVIDYMRVPIGGRKSLLPEAGVVSVLDREGNMQRNEARFSGCRSYAGESTINFGDPSDVKPAEAQRRLTLPAGISIEVRLTKRVDLHKVSLGEKLPMDLTHAVQTGDVDFAKNSPVIGHVTSLTPGRRGYVCVGIGLSAIETPQARAEFDARLDDVQLAPIFGELTYGKLCFKPQQGTMPAGLRMSWTTK